MICLNIFFRIVVLIGILWSGTFGADEAQSPTCLGEQLLELLTKWRQDDVLPFPLPPLKLITLPSFEGQYSGYGIKLSYSTGAMNLIGVNEFLIEELNVSTNNGLNTSGIIQFPLLTLTSDDYSVKGKAYAVYNLKGSGVMRIAFDNVRVPFELGLGSQGEGSHIVDLRLDFDLDDVRVDLANSSWPINRILNAEGLDIIKSYHSSFVDLATGSLKSTLDQYLKNVSIKELLSIFIGNCMSVLIF